MTLAPCFISLSLRSFWRMAASISILEDTFWWECWDKADITDPIIEGMLRGFLVPTHTFCSPSIVSPMLGGSIAVSSSCFIVLATRIATQMAIHCSALAEASECEPFFHSLRPAFAASPCRRLRRMACKNCSLEVLMMSSRTECALSIFSLLSSLWTASFSQRPWGDQICMYSGVQFSLMKVEAGFMVGAMSNKGARDMGCNSGSTFRTIL
mmetsp:Transcript_37902/g.80545  ORF Transcript_37902/g.80545 Transcript_37902/m.80545 type:complete len:211 (+) Transcript_37902:840-1472(+)